MLSSAQERLLRWLGRIYGLMLLAYPLTFRDEYSREMMVVFQDRARDVAADGSIWALVPFCLHLFWDWLTSVLHERSDMAILRKALLAAATVICSVSVAASCFLGLSYAMLKGLGDIRPLIPLALFVAQGAVTLVALYANTLRLRIDVLALVGGMGIAWLGYSMVERTLSGPHFEGYAIVLGVIGVLQGVLTLMAFLSRWTNAGRTRAAV